MSKENKEYWIKSLPSMVVIAAALLFLWAGLAESVASVIDSTIVSFVSNELLRVACNVCIVVPSLAICAFVLWYGVHVIVSLIFGEKPKSLREVFKVLAFKSADAE